LTLNALAIVGNLRCSQGAGMDWTKKLDRIQWSLHNSDWEGICRFNGRIVKNNVTTKALAAYIEDRTN
jgi:hypothetical protein